MDATKRTAHLAGIIYFLFMIVAIVGEFVLPRVLVSGDAAATARNLAAGEQTYRLAILNTLVTLVLFIALVATLHRLFRDVDSGQALFMVLLVTVGIAVAFANLLVRFLPLAILGEAEHLTAFTRPQLDALVLGVLRAHGAGSAVATVFWGLWLFPFGRLVMRSGFLPRVLGVLLMIAGVGYLATGVTAIVLPEHRRAVAQAMMPLYFGEVPIIFWLLLVGARVRRAVAPVAGGHA